MLSMSTTTMGAQVDCEAFRFAFFFEFFSDVVTPLEGWDML